MKKFSLVTILLLAIFFTKVYGQAPLKTINPDDEFILIEDMSDEFNAGSINWSDRWEKTNNLPNIAAWNLTNASNVSEDNYFNRGAARITARYNGIDTDGTSIAINGKFYNAGCLQSQKSLPPNFEGYVEAVIRGADIDNSDPHPFSEGIDRSRGLCPSFWLYSKFFDNNPAEGDVIYTEIDIQELQQHDFHDNVQDGVEDTESNLHIAFKDGNKRRWVRPKRNPEEQLNKYELGFDPRKDWHTYGCEITKEELNFFVDGKKVGKTLKNTHWGKLPLRVIMSLGMRVPFVDFGGNAFTSFDPQGTYPNNDRLQNLAERARKQLGELPESMYVDYVRVWNKKSNTSNPPSNDKFFIVNRYTGNKLSPSNNKNKTNIKQVAATNVSNFVKWKKVETNNGWFYLENVETGKSFRPRNEESRDGNMIEQFMSNSNNTWSQWREVTANSGYVFLENRASRKYIRPKTNKENTPIELRSSSLTTNWTQWKLQPVILSSISSTGIDNNDLKVFPNPSSNGTINIKLQELKSPSKLTITDLNGKVLYSKKVMKKETQLIPKLQRGIYILKIKKGNSILNKRIIIH